MLYVNRIGSEPHRNICWSHPFWTTCRVSSSFPALRNKRSKLRKRTQISDDANYTTWSRVQCKHIRLEGSTITAVLHERMSKYAIVWVLLKKALRNSTENNWFRAFIPHSYFISFIPSVSRSFSLKQLIKFYLYPSHGTAPPVRLCNRFHANGLRTTDTHIQMYTVCTGWSISLCLLHTNCIKWTSFLSVRKGSSPEILDGWRQ